MFSLCDADSDIADWLATIHLERYQETFKRHGYQVARDAVSLGNEDLQRIGITATGHRKRILNLVQQMQLLVHDKGRPMAEDPAPPIAKPVPKPRTFFQRPSPATRPEQGLMPTPLARTSVPTRKPGCEGSSAAFIVHEGFVPGESSMDLGRSEFTLEQQAGSGERGSVGPQEHESRAQRIDWILQNDTKDYAMVEAPQAEGSQFSLPSHLYPDEVLDDLTISPYASYTLLSERPPTMLSGWLDKLSPQGNYVFQRRFVRFDGKNLMYFHSEKEPYPKGVIPLSVIEMARATKENKFQVVTSHRIFLFRAENEAQRNEWCSTLQRKVAEQRLVSPQPRWASSTHCQKCGTLELKGHKSKLFAVLSLSNMWLYKNEQFFKMGIAICLIELHGATIREAKNRSFELISPLKIFSFVAESEREKREWMEALQDAIAEMLYDYEVAEKIWSNKANKFCADCRARSPDWASINLCVVICKQCAGQHRSLGSSVSKVQSLKLDTSVWSNEIVQLFIMLGNERANRFWAARLSPSEALYPDSSAEQRQVFVTHKYRDGRYRRPHPSYTSQDDVLMAVLRLLCLAGSPNTQELSLEGVYNEITQPVVHSGYLYKVPALSKYGPGPLVARMERGLHRVWCSLEKSLLFYETDKCAESVGKVELADMVSLGVSRADGLASPGPPDRYPSFSLFLPPLATQTGAQPSVMPSPCTQPGFNQSLHSMQWFTPLSCHCLLGYEFQRVGRLRYRSMLNPEQWLQGFFILQKAHLFLCPGEEGAAEDSINLRRLQELSVVPLTETPEKKEVLILVEMGRTFYLQGVTRMDIAAWCADIQASAGGRGNALRDQQLSRSDIPILVDSCIAFITQYGLRHEGIYRKNGAKSRIKVLMEQFRRDARNVKLRISDNFIEDVTDVLKRFFRELKDPVFTSELHPQWKEAAALKPQRLERYKELINRLPRLNRRTLAALIGHLYRVQKCADFNQMSTKNLSLLFAPSLFQTDGKGEHEVKVMEDLIDNYVCIFNIDEDQVSQMDLENSLITTWRDVQLSQAGDLIIEVYLEQKLPDCCVTLKVSPTMTAEELTNQVLEMRNMPASLDIWLTFEALENGELERPLHPKEKVLEQALQWCKLPEPSTAYLLVRKVPIGEGSCLFTGAKRESPKCGVLKCREEPPKLLGCKFQERYFVIQDHKLLLLKEKRSARPEREWPLNMAKVYMGIRKKLKPPSQWGFTLILDKQHLYLACTGQAELWDWTTSILKAQHDDLRPVIMRRRSSSDLTKQKFGTMPLIPLRGDNTDATMLSANQTLVRQCQHPQSLAATGCQPSAPPPNTPTQLQTGPQPPDPAVIPLLPSKSLISSPAPVPAPPARAFTSRLVSQPAAPALIPLLPSKPLIPSPAQSPQPQMEPSPTPHTPTLCPNPEHPTTP
uniref:ArfGAP with RhoGAP domain, ankyrin repeat and PH domain 3 n=1 Tax=Gopherus evgoodei TaxID=1825980 RepID=A0A8C4YLW6_9SAUR